MINLTVIIFIFIYVLIIMTLALLIYSYIDYLKIAKEIDKILDEADEVINDEWNGYNNLYVYVITDICIIYDCL